jgi:hypothetical protein
MACSCWIWRTCRTIAAARGESRSHGQRCDSRSADWHRPAYWTVGSGTWPSTGEIDVVEFTNNGPQNLMALHTLPGCSIAGSHMTGQLDYNNCNVSVPHFTWRLRHTHIAAGRRGIYRLRCPIEATTWQRCNVQRHWRRRLHNGMDSAVGARVVLPAWLRP